MVGERSADGLVEDELGVVARQTSKVLGHPALQDVQGGVNPRHPALHLTMGIRADQVSTNGIRANTTFHRFKEEQRVANLYYKACRVVQTADLE